MAHCICMYERFFGVFQLWGMGQQNSFSFSSFSSSCSSSHSSSNSVAKFTTETTSVSFKVDVFTFDIMRGGVLESVLESVSSIYGWLWVGFFAQCFLLAVTARPSSLLPVHRRGTYTGLWRFAPPPLNEVASFRIWRDPRTHIEAVLATNIWLDFCCPYS